MIVGDLAVVAQWRKVAAQWALPRATLAYIGAAGAAPIGGEVAATGSR